MAKLDSNLYKNVALISAALTTINDICLEWSFSEGLLTKRALIGLR